MLYLKGECKTHIPSTNIRLRVKVNLDYCIIIFCCFSDTKKHQILDNSKATPYLYFTYFVNKAQYLFKMLP